MALNVDENWISGHSEAFKNNIEHLKMKKNGFIMKVEDDLGDYLSHDFWFHSRE